MKKEKPLVFKGSKKRINYFIFLNLMPLIGIIFYEFYGMGIETILYNLEYRAMQPISFLLYLFIILSILGYIIFQHKKIMIYNEYFEYKVGFKKIQINYKEIEAMEFKNEKFWTVIYLEEGLMGNEKKIIHVFPFRKKFKEFIFILKSRNSKIIFCEEIHELIKGYEEEWMKEKWKKKGFDWFKLILWLYTFSIIGLIGFGIYYLLYLL